MRVRRRGGAPLCHVVREGAGTECAAGLPVPRGSVLTRTVLRSLAVLAVLGLVVTSAALILFARSLAGIRGDFCAWTRNHYQASLTLPQVPGRVRAEQSDIALLRQLGCK